MTDFNALYTPGDLDEFTINTVVEISKGSMLKIEYNREKGTFELDRVEPEILQSHQTMDSSQQHLTKMETNSIH